MMIKLVTVFLFVNFRHQYRCRLWRPLHIENSVWLILYEYTQTQCDGGARDGIDIWYMSLSCQNFRWVFKLSFGKCLSQSEPSVDSLSDPGLSPQFENSDENINFRENIMDHNLWLKNSLSFQRIELRRAMQFLPSPLHPCLATFDFIFL